MKRLKLYPKKILCLASFLIILDQLTKLIAKYLLKSKSIVILPGLINYNLVYNYGASFGILNNQAILLSIISFIVSVVLTIVVIKNSLLSSFRKLSLIFLLAGTIGNGIDRWFFGYVTDFIQLVPISFPVFNLADIYINIAIIIIFFEYILSYLSARKIINKNEN